MEILNFPYLSVEHIPQDSGKVLPDSLRWTQVMLPTLYLPLLHPYDTALITCSHLFAPQT